MGNSYEVSRGFYQGTQEDRIWLSTLEASVHHVCDLRDTCNDLRDTCHHLYADTGSTSPQIHTPAYDILAHSEVGTLSRAGALFTNGWVHVSSLRLTLGNMPYKKYNKKLNCLNYLFFLIEHLPSNVAE